MTTETRSNRNSESKSEQARVRSCSDLQRCLDALFAIRRGPLQVVAIHPEGRSWPLIRTFEPENESIHTWVRFQNESRNVYFTLNESAEKPDQKPRCRDITSVYGVGFDCDPIPGQPLQAEKARYKKLASELLSIAKYPPTFIIFTGNGIQGVFLFKEPLIKFERDRIRYIGQRLQNTFPGADSTANLDRLYRLPGSINHPNAAKRRRGCIRAKSSLLLPAKGARIRKYSLEAF